MGLALIGDMTLSSRNFAAARLLDMYEWRGSKVTISGMFFLVTGRCRGFNRWILSVWEAFFRAAILYF